MSTYKQLVGKYVKSYSSDPSVSYAEGELWYNTSSNTFKTSVLVYAWASGGNYPISVREFYGVGTQTAGLGFNGTSPGGTNISSEYN